MKKIILLCFSLVLIICNFHTVKATDQLEDLKIEYGNQLNQINQQIAELRETSLNINNQITNVNNDIINLKVQIKEAEDSITNTEDKIKNKRKEILDKNKELQQANKDKDKQYQAMKKRIKYIYENGQSESLAVLLCSDQDDLIDFLNKVEYTQKLHEYDRDMLNKYIATIQKIERIKKKLKQEKEQLQGQKKFLQAQKIGLEENKNNLEKQVLKLEQQENEVNGNISLALENAEALANEIVYIDYKIVQIEAEKQRILQEQAILITEAEQHHQGTAAINDDTYEEETDYYEEYEYQEEQNEILSQAIEQLTDEVLSSYDIVSYANEFVGNPYVYGGSSLINGIDCSHFVYQVLTNTGYYDGEYVTSTNWANLGSSVSSLGEAVAGDVIVYSGHVAIYDGQGGIIQAQSPSAGITNNRSADSSTILAIRRFE